jgi:histidyl-tRNA synthetase
LRAIDKFDRVGLGGVKLLLGEGRKDESGDFTKGAGLAPNQIDTVTELLTAPPERFQGSPAVQDLNTVLNLVRESGYGVDRVALDTTIIRGLDYYTGIVFEAQLTFPVQNEKGQTVVFGSVGGGGRYDDLVARFTGQKTPAVGFSIGVSRLLTALQMRKATVASVQPLVVVTVMDKAEVASSFAMVRELRAAGVRAEAYVGTGKLGDQFKYADKRGAALAVIEGSDERANRKVQIKDLALGAELAKSVESRADWVANREAQVTVDRAALVAEIRKLLARGH